jgi:hypothetical protein
MSLIPFAPFSANMATHPISKTKQLNSSVHKQNSSAPNGLKAGYGKKTETGVSLLRLLMLA